MIAINNKINFSHFNLMTLLQCEISLHTSGEANNFGSDALSIAIKETSIIYMVKFS